MDDRCAREAAHLALSDSLEPFRDLVWREGASHYRDLPWRRTRDPYGIWVSEVMLQQTQVSRVDGRWQRWLSRFPDTTVLADAETADVLEEWQGLGYNRRALALHRAARAIEASGGVFPCDEPELLALPGIGPATAAGIRAFAFDLPGAYLETNVRAVFLHELFPDAEKVPDSVLAPLVRDACPPAGDPGRGPRAWYYALLDYGAHLKRTVPNPSQRSRSHVRQSRFEGSHRQKRAEVVRLLLDARASGEPMSAERIAVALDGVEVAAGRPAVAASELEVLLAELVREGFCALEDGRYVL